MARQIKKAFFGSFCERDHQFWGQWLSEVQHALIANMSGQLPDGFWRNLFLDPEFQACRKPRKLSGYFW